MLCIHGVVFHCCRGTLLIGLVFGLFDRKYYYGVCRGCLERKGSCTLCVKGPL